MLAPAVSSHPYFSRLKWQIKCGGRIMIGGLVRGVYIKFMFEVYPRRWRLNDLLFRDICISLYMMIM